DVAVGAVELGIDVEHSLHMVIARRNVADAAEGVARYGAVDDRGLARRERIDVEAEDRHAAAERVCLEPRLGYGIAAQDHEHAAGDRLGMSGGGKGKRELELGWCGDGDGAQDEREAQATTHVASSAA